ncbi:MAG: N-acetylmuramoyl-L-alanine amidase, partial [Alphaproteobacteria bacterium]
PRPGLKPKSTKPLLIVVDPGHGGADPGAIAKNGTYEKNVTLAAARALEVMLIELGYNVVLSRRSDKYITLSARTEVAQNNNADLFISLHADKHKNRSVRGASVYTLSEKASDAETEALAARENEVDSLFDVSNSDEYEEDVRRILISLVQRTTMTCSAKFAGELITELKKSTKLLGRTHRFAGFRVLKAPNVPSVLVEMGYMSNDKDRKMLLSEAGRYALMRRVAQAIEDYFSRHESCSQAS